MLTLKSIHETLQDLKFNPKKPGPMSILAEVNSLEYHKQAAQVEIKRSALKTAAMHLIIALAWSKHESEKEAKETGQS